MIDECTQGNVLALATRAMIDLLLVCRAIKMLVEAPQRGESSGAEIASIALSIPRCARGNRGRLVAITMVFDQLVREEMVPVDLSAILVYLLTINPGGAAARFKVERHAGKIGEFVRAPRAFDILADMNRRLEVL